MTFDDKRLWSFLRERRSSPDTLLHEFHIVVPPVDVESLARSMGITVTRLHSPGWSGAVQVTSSERADIWLDEVDSSLRQRFTIAHELGHLMMHDVHVRAYRDASFSGTPEESEANKFAAALLMPFWMLEIAAAQHRGNVQSLAKLFEVSEEAMDIRLGKLVRWG